MRAVHDHSGGSRVVPALLDNVTIPSKVHRVHLSRWLLSPTLHSVIQSGLIPGGKDAKQGTTNGFFTAVDRLDEHQDCQENYDVTKPRIVQELYLPGIIGKCTRTQCIASSCRLLKRKGLTFDQTRTDAIILHDSVPADCIAKVVSMKTQEILHEGVTLSPRHPPKIVLKTA